MPRCLLTDDELHKFREDGYFIARGLYDAEEMDLLSRAARQDKALDDHGFGLDDYISHPAAVVDGFATAPDRTGHGVDFEWEALEPLRAPELAGTLV